MAALFLLGLLTPPPATAQAGSAARGSYRFLLAHERLKSVEFDASTDAKGVTTGQMTFTDDAAIADVDDAEDPRAGDPPAQAALLLFQEAARREVATSERVEELMAYLKRARENPELRFRWARRQGS
jgi:hypothetical protein